MNLAKILKQRRDAERRLELTSPKPVFNGGAADSVEGAGGEIISDGVTLAQLTTGLAGKSDTDHAHEFVDLTDAPSAYTGAGGKIVAVNSGATALEFVAAPAATNGVPAGGTTDQLAAKNSNTDYDLKWVDAPNAANGIPTGGTTEQILSKIDSTDYNAHWVDKPSGGSSPLTTKGDVFVYGSADARLPIGSNGQVLTADSAQTLGVKWADASSGGGAISDIYTAIATSDSSAYNPTPTDNTDVPDMSITLPASDAERTVLLSGLILCTRADTYRNRHRILLDTTTIVENLWGVENTEALLRQLTLSDVIITIPGDSASHTIKVQFSASGSTGATTFNYRCLIAKVLA